MTCTQEEARPLEPTDEMIAKAIPYNKKRYTRPELQFIQAAIGSRPDGLSTEEFARDVYEFQGEFIELEDDCKLGPKSFLELIPYVKSLPWREVRQGVWWDWPPGRSVSSIKKIVRRLRIAVSSSSRSCSTRPGSASFGQNGPRGS